MRLKVVVEYGRDQRPWRRCREVDERKVGEDVDGLGLFCFRGGKSFFRLVDYRSAGASGVRKLKMTIF